MKTRIMYIELKCVDGHNDRGPARIGRVTFSKTGKTIRYRDLELQRGNGICSNYYDVNTGDEYWVSGPKKNGQDRHPVGGGPVEIDDDVREEYWTQIRNLPDRAKERLA
jgi:hypothetical protein